MTAKTATVRRVAELPINLESEQTDVRDVSMAMRQRVSALEATAFHEAGHAFLAVERRLPLRYVTIEPNEDSLGHIRGKAWPESFRPDINADRQTTKRLEDQVLMVMAGGVAEYLRTGRRNNVGASGDFHQAVDIAGYLHPDETVLSAYLKFVDAYLVSMLSPVEWKNYRWSMVERIAEALLTSTTLTPSEVRRLVSPDVSNVLARQSSRGDTASKGVAPVATLPADKLAGITARDATK